MNRPINKHKIAERKGRRAEIIAAWWLRLQGYHIIGRRVKNPRGEIDIIARRMGIVVFVEVKSRHKSADLANSIDAYKMRRVVAAAKAEAHKYICKDDDIRFDVILITSWKWPIHIKNIWHDG